MSRMRLAMQVAPTSYQPTEPLRMPYKLNTTFDLRLEQSYSIYIS
jgi:hypothetical protein